MRQKKVFTSILAATGLALLANALWLTELIWDTGWDQFTWLQWPQYAIFGINTFLVWSYLLPIAHLKDISWKKLWMPALELYFVAIITFFIAKSILYALFLPIAIFELSPYILWLMLGALILTTASSFYYLTRNYLYPVKPAFVPVMIGAELIAGICALLSGYLLSEHSALEAVLLTAVKTGLPFFFLTLFIGLFSILSIHKLSLQQRAKDRAEILDDMML